ncbi:protein-L-isoaspartate O-methyltransferase [Sphingomonas daechungensis]|uniref:Protein-L-isoaspartate O-methyltransferase n=1 Tax=Sphingomonas daechungensis TaxID=1176646 RepID=A0ABX6T3J0_9SPHN|nr:protein-L-isoaspartate O-methyltransferase [Sphingomonas daechungensis]QNP43575.1 protein-L-isoaspartate O-methyltransferase [Sphingomonas daechungensis]
MTAHAPVPDYAAARQAMVDSQLRPQGVNDPSVIEAMSVVPREKFVPDELKPLAYIDRSIPLGEGRALTSSAVLGLLLTALTPLRGERALIVGAATGYSAAVMAELGLEVVALESSTELAAIARKNRAKPIEGPLQEGYPAKAPYDLILIDGAVEYVPDALIDQLVDGGRLGGAIVDKGITRLFVGRKVGGGFGQISIADMATPALPGFERPRVFTF